MYEEIFEPEARPACEGEARPACEGEARPACEGEARPACEGEARPACEGEARIACETICNTLEKLYPDAKCSLDYEEPWQLIIAARLSAQCTDERVNKITPELFRRYKTLEDFSKSDIMQLEEMVHSCGFYHSKARDIKALCGKLSELGYIPETIDELVKLPGIGRKTANLIMGDIHGKPSIVTDTHFIRITGRLGLTKNTVPVKVETDLRKIIPPELSTDFCHRIVYFGRDICKARNPECHRCPFLSEFCKGV